ncbi:MAG: hypothetical protein EHM24_15430 [Acidobacteria bacterium]|nr:MAG: hypothetical protein EHM24_15430 [Acidobacteriota bacterium]
MKQILSAFGDGTRRVAGAPAILAAVLVLTLLVALPPAIVMRGLLAQSLGQSLAADSAAAGVNAEWWEEFTSGATGLGSAFTPRTMGFGGVLDNLSRVLDNRRLPAAVAVVVSGYVLLWLFLVGGILDRYARNRPTRAVAFFSACGVFFFRFLRLGVVGLAVYALLFGPVHGWLFGTVYAWATRDLTVEREAFGVRAGLYLLFGVLLVACNVLFDYAKIRAVVEDRRSMIGALVAAWRFLRRHPLHAAGLYLLNGLLFVAVIAGYAFVAPGAGTPGWSLWLGLLVTEAYLLARLAIKLQFLASQTSLFQGLLAHSEYIAAPLPTWPESASAEAIAPAPAERLDRDQARADETGREA